MNNRENMIIEGPIKTEVQNGVVIKESKIEKHSTRDMILDQIIAVMKERKSAPKGEQWDALSEVRAGNYFSRSTIKRQFPSFDEAVKLALEKAKNDGIYIYLNNHK
ncbi:MAG: hypothetical protein WC241_04845 [Candidatus Paceibacterota bacterium]|jgi:hypothetical protein